MFYFKIQPALLRYYQKITISEDIKHSKRQNNIIQNTFPLTSFYQI